jgi:hypothetical protein
VIGLSCTPLRLDQSKGCFSGIAFQTQALRTRTQGTLTSVIIPGTRARSSSGHARLQPTRARQNFVATIASTQLVRAAANGSASAATWAARMEQVRGNACRFTGRGSRPDPRVSGQRGRGRPSLADRG